MLYILVSEWEIESLNFVDFVLIFLLIACLADYDRFQAQTLVSRYCLNIVHLHVFLWTIFNQWYYCGLEYRLEKVSLCQWIRREAFIDGIGSVVFRQVFFLLQQANCWHARKWDSSVILSEHDQSFVHPIHQVQILNCQLIHASSGLQYVGEYHVDASENDEGRDQGKTFYHPTNQSGLYPHNW